MVAAALTAFSGLAPGLAPAVPVSRNALQLSAEPVSRYLDGPQLDDATAADRALAVVAHVPVRVTARAAACGAEAAWRLNGKAPRAKPHRDAHGCHVLLRLAPRGRYELHVRPTPHSTLSTLSFVLADRLVVALGDSVAAGEGNPGKDNNRRWASARCHRSPVAGPEQAAHVLAQDPATTGRVAAHQALRSITFVNLACSGATVPHGVLGPYRGIEHPSGAPEVPSQLERLAALRRKPDAVTISVGANDVYFGDAVRLCLTTPDCPRRRLHGAKTAHEAIGAALGELPKRYAALAARLERARIARGQTFITEYFDPTRGRDGQTCRSIAHGAITRHELEWAQTALLEPLNEEVAAAAHRHGWHLVDGIAAAFATHGYCMSAQERWVRRIEESTSNLAGPFHPTAAGQAAIADALIPPLGRSLGFPIGAHVRSPDGDGGPSALVVIAVLVALVLLVGLALRFVPPLWRFTRRFVRRFKHLATFGHPAPRPEPQQLPTLKALSGNGSGPGALTQTLLKAAAALATAVVSVGFVVVVGAAIVWVRFWAARYPADQAVDVVSRDELLVIGAQALVLFALAAVLAVVLLWLVEPKGRAGRRLTLALALLIFLGLSAAAVIGDFSPRQVAWLVCGFALGSVLLVLLARAAPRLVRSVKRRGLSTPGQVATYIAGRYLPAAAAATHSWKRWGLLPAVVALVLAGLVSIRLAHVGPLEDQLVPWAMPLVVVVALTFVLFRRIAIELYAVLALIAAVGSAFSFTHADNRMVFVTAAIAVAAVLFALPPQPFDEDEATAAADDVRSAYLSSARAALAATVFASLGVILARDEWWLAVAALAALTLAGLCVAVAAVSGNRFAPVAVVVAFSVCAFGAVLACVRTVDAPQVQPVAILLADRSAICGVWVGESSGRVWYARLHLSDRAAARRPVNTDTALASVARKDVVDMALGPLQPVARAQDQAASLREALAREHRFSGHPASRCGPLRPPQQRVARTPGRIMAKSVQPELIVDRRDGFWPVSVLTLLRMQDRRARICRRVGDGTCVRMLTQSDFTFNGGEGEWLDYPADVRHRSDEQRLFRDALGSLDPAVSAREYFLVSRGPGPHGAYTVQFWFFYPYNYLQTADVLQHVAGVHEGDWETVAFLLSARSHEPRYVWMARHSNEGRMFVWDEEHLVKRGGHLVAYAARGSHATYERCGRQHRNQAPLGLIDDRPQCDPDEELHLAPESTHIVDLSRTPWACWRGRFGESVHGFVLSPDGHVIHQVPYEADDGPLGPLWQQRFGGKTFEPCRGVRVPEDREVDQRGNPGEEVLPDKASAQLRTHAGTLDAAVDECRDWEHAPAGGAFLLACNQDQLRRYLTSGLEAPPPAGLRIDVMGRMAHTGPVTVPAVRRDPREASLDAWRITAARSTHAQIFAGCQSGDDVLEARFGRVEVARNAQLRVDTRSWPWAIRDPRGEVLKTATPKSVKKRANADSGQRCHTS